MQIRRQSMMTKEWHDREIDVTEEQMEDWRNGALIQNAMPNVSNEDREFIMTGITPEEWEEVFGAQQELKGTKRG